MGGRSFFAGFSVNRGFLGRSDFRDTQQRWRENAQGFLASRGESPLAPKAARTLLEAHVDQEQEPLRGREREILALVAAGHPNKIIARRLGISEKTVKAHLTSVYRQIGVTDRVQAALWAREHGITS